MTAIAILAAGGFVAWLWGCRVNRMTPDELMGAGLLLLAPWVAIAVAVVVALIVWA
jgi:hypothetical protein